MKIEGMTPGRAQGTVIIPRGEGKNPFRLTVQAMPMDVIARAEAMFPDPKPPIRYRKKPGTGILIKHPLTGAAIEYEDRTDPTYKAADEKASRLQGMVFIEEALRVDPSIQWETTKNGQSDEAYYQALWDEMLAFGFSVGDLKLIQKRIWEVSNLSSKEVEAVAEAFLSEHSQGKGPLPGSTTSEQRAEPSGMPLSEPPSA